METAYDGRQVVGMDLHRRRSVLVRMTEDGRRLGTARITNSPAGLRREIARAGKSPKVVLEATYGWYWAADTLAAAGAEVHLAHPLGVKAFSYRRVKNDERDAADLADLLRMGRLPEAWIAPPRVRELRELTRYRIKLVHLRTSCKDQVHAVLAKLGVPVTCPGHLRGGRVGVAGCPAPAAALCREDDFAAPAGRRAVRRDHDARRRDRRPAGR
jgi:transposase